VIDDAKAIHLRDLSESSDDQAEPIEVTERPEALHNSLCVNHLQSVPGL
jgi:hypothetical protein